MPVHTYTNILVRGIYDDSVVSPRGSGGAFIAGDRRKETKLSVRRLRVGGRGYAIVAL